MYVCMYGGYSDGIFDGDGDIDIDEGHQGQGEGCQEGGKVLDENQADLRTC